MESDSISGGGKNKSGNLITIFCILKS